MKLSDFDYNLPKELIAQYPSNVRDASRLLVVDRKNESIAHKKFSRILEYFNPGDLLVLNNSKVLPARVFGRREKTGAKIEFLLIKKEGGTFSVMVKPAKKFQIGENIVFGENNGGLYAKIVDKNKIAFERGNPDEIYKLGTMPLPPYIKRNSEGLDFERYQTVFAKIPGSIAAPTAGLHFSKELLGEIKDRAVEVNYVTLHVGVGTFKPVKTEDVAKHKMEPEFFEIGPELIGSIKKAKKQKGRIFSVGTTSCRVIETITELPIVHDLSPVTHSGFTNLFIYPGYSFKAVDCLLTNFHLPKTTLFMLVCAFAGRELIMRAYQEAIEEKYRFYSYGDAMLIV
ncbi:MAG: tRNA preQ1(34) S-adenosylmethionine ribosyltransferase-isomerase QueA [Candidatus Omnitrophota bacterium]